MRKYTVGVYSHKLSTFKQNDYHSSRKHNRIYYITLKTFNIQDKSSQPIKNQEYVIHSHKKSQREKEKDNPGIDISRKKF